MVDPATVEFLSPGNFGYNAFVQTLHLPAFVPEFPFVSLKKQRISCPIPRPAGHIRTEEAAGFLVANPYLLLLLIFPFLPGRKERARPPEFLWLAAAVLLIGAVNFVVIAFFSYASLRYWLDYLPWLVLLFCIAWTRTDESLSMRGTRWSLRIIACLLIAASLLVHIGLAIQRMAV